MKKAMLMLSLATMTIAATAQPDQKDEEKIRSIFNTIETGWNSKSAEKFASVFAEEHDYIVVNGLYFPGFTRQRNAAAHQGLFDGIYKNSVVKLKVDKIRMLRPDLAIVTTLGSNNHEGGALPADPVIIMTVVVEKKKDDWKIISFHNHLMALDPKSSPPLNVMFASWYN